MVYIYLPVACYHLSGCHKGEFVGGGVFRCPSGLSCFFFPFPVAKVDRASVVRGRPTYIIPYNSVSVTIIIKQMLHRASFVPKFPTMTCLYSRMVQGTYRIERHATTHASKWRPDVTV